MYIDERVFSCAEAKFSAKDRISENILVTIGCGRRTYTDIFM